MSSTTLRRLSRRSTCSDTRGPVGLRYLSAACVQSGAELRKIHRSSRESSGCRRTRHRVARRSAGGSRSARRDACPIVRRRGSVRERLIRLHGRSGGSPERLLYRGSGRADCPGRSLGDRKVDAHFADPETLRPGRGTGDDRRPRRTKLYDCIAEIADQRRTAGERSVRDAGMGQHRSRMSFRDWRAGERGGAPGERR
jgi:hypothetical protein